MTRVCVYGYFEMLMLGNQTQPYIIVYQVVLITDIYRIHFACYKARQSLIFSAPNSVFVLLFYLGSGQPSINLADGEINTEP